MPSFSLQNFNFQNEDVFIIVLFLFIMIIASFICYMSSLLNKKSKAEPTNKAVAAQQRGYPLPTASLKTEAKAKEQPSGKEKKGRKLFGGKKEEKTVIPNAPTLPKIPVKQELPVTQNNNPAQTQSFAAASPQQVEELSQPKPEFSTIQEPVLQQNPPELEKPAENNDESEENSEGNKEKSLYDLFNDDSAEETEVNKFASQLDDINMDSILDTGNDLLSKIKSNLN